jgi:truncated hemoglobin YjbI
MEAAKGKSLLGDNFFEQVGGRSCIERVHSILYTKLFKHPWLKGFFTHTKREVVESQQTDFWTGLMGGPAVYGGRSPRDAHVHMFMPAEVFAIRHKLLGDSLIEAGVAPDLRKKWMALDAGFERAIVNKSPDECHGRYRTEEVIIVPKPDGYSA